MHPDLIVGVAGLIVAFGSGIIAWLQLRRTPKGSIEPLAHDTVPLRKPIINSPIFLQPPSGRLPEQVRGRDAILDELREVVRIPDGKVHIVTGMGGVGKSAVTLKIAEYATEIGYEAWWVASSVASPLTSTLLGLARYLGASPFEMEECLAGVRNPSDLLWQYLQAYHRWVLIIDNADDIDEFIVGDRLAKDGNGWLRTTTNGLLLVTSRNSKPSDWGSHTCIHKLDVLPTDVGAQLLLDLTPKGGTRESACRIAAELGGLPLALRHAGLYLAQPFVTERTFDAYLSELSRSTAELLKSQSNNRGDERSTLRGTWDLSLGLLERQGIADARRTLRLLCVCSAPNQIPLAIFQSAVQQDILPRHMLSETLSALADIGLIASQEAETSSDNKLASYKVIILHPLVAEGVCSESSGAELSVSIQNLIKIMSATISKLDRQNSTDWPIWVMLVPHLSKILANSVTKTLGEDIVNELLHTCARVISTLAIASEHSRCEDLVEQIRPYVSLFSATTLVSITARYCIAHANRTRSYSTAGEKEFREILKLQVRLLGEDHPDSLHTRHNLAHTLAANGKLDEAVAQFRETIDRRTQVLGPTSDVCLSSRRALLFYLVKEGRIVEAKQQLDELARITADLWSADYPVALSLRYNAAIIRIIERDTDKLEIELRDILRRQTVVIGKGHDDTLKTRMALADVYELQGKIPAAKRQLRIVSSYHQHLRGRTHPTVQAARERLASMA